MATTTNFGWTTPDDTDLVKDGAAAIRTLGSAIDTSLVDLKGGTTGQVLSKASNTDMDFTWSPVSAGSITSLATGTLAASTTGVSLTSISGDYVHLQLVIYNYIFADDDYLAFRFNSDTGNNYSNAMQDFNASSVSDDYILGANSRAYANGNFAADQTGTGYVSIMDIYNYADSTMHKQFYIKTNDLRADGTAQIGRQNVGRYLSNTAISSIQVITFGGNAFAGGSYILRGIK